MTFPSGGPRSRETAHGSTRSVSPARVLAVVGVLLVLFFILAPQPELDESASFSSNGAGPNGTRGLYEVLGRLGFRVGRNVSVIRTPPDSGSVYVVLQPSLPLSTTELATLLRGVSHGAIIVFTAENESLADSLGFGLIAPNRYYTLDNAAVAGGNPRQLDSIGGSRPVRVPFPINAYVGSTSRTGNQPFLWLEPSPGFRAPTEGRPAADTSSRPALVRGHAFGNGYAIAIAPSLIITNRAVRDTRPAIAMVQALRYACGRVSSTRSCGSVVFDEYHHGFGSHADMVGAIRHALTDTAPGRVTLGFLAASLVLLVAFAVRPLAPLPAPVVSRRSPLEHVGALAHAYTQVDARRLGALQLLRGLRRRHPLGMPMSVPDAAYLSVLEQRFPPVSTFAQQIAAVVATDSRSQTGFATIGEAFANIERVFTN